MSIVCYLFMSVSFLLMPADIFSDKVYAENIVWFSGSCFWVFLLIGVILQIVLAVRYKKSAKNQKSECRVGIISFLKNPFGIAADIILVISIIGFVVSMIVTNSRGYICYIFISLLVFSFSTHCVLNGKVYCNIKGYK